MKFLKNADTPTIYKVLGEFKQARGAPSAAAKKPGRRRRIVIVEDAGDDE